MISCKEARKIYQREYDEPSKYLQYTAEAKSFLNGLRLVVVTNVKKVSNSDEGFIGYGMAIRFCRAALCLCGLIIINECGRWQGVARGCGRIWCMGAAGCGI